MSVLTEEFCKMSERDLLRNHGAIIDELRRRNVVKTRNNPIADYTDWLVCRSLNLRVESNPSASVDAIDDKGNRYNIKGRRDRSNNVQMGAIRNLEDAKFDSLIAVAFNDDYSVRFGASIPYDTVVEASKYREHVNAHILTVNDSILRESSVSDITRDLRRYERK